MNKALERVPLSRQHASVAHLVERHLAKVEVASSSLVTRSKCNHAIRCTQWYILYFASVAHLVERHLAKVEVASSSLVTRSKKKDTT